MPHSEPTFVRVLSGRGLRTRLAPTQSLFGNWLLALASTAIRSRQIACAVALSRTGAARVASSSSTRPGSVWQCLRLRPACMASSRAGRACRFPVPLPRRTPARRPPPRLARLGSCRSQTRLAPRTGLGRHHGRAQRRAADVERFEASPHDHAGGGISGARRGADGLGLPRQQQPLGAGRGPPPLQDGGASRCLVLVA